MQEIQDIYTSSGQVEEIKKIFLNQKQNRIILHKLNGSAKALVASSCFKELKGLHLFVFPEKEDAAFFYHDLEQILNEKEIEFSEKKVFFLPSSYRKSYQFDDIENFNVLLRNNILQQLSKEKTQIIVTYSEAVCERVVSQQTLEKQKLFIKQGDILTLDEVMMFLSESEFEYSDYVFQPGQFTVRGGIIDVFSYNNEFPYRIEFYDDTIKSLREFDIESQISRKTIENIEISPNISPNNSTENEKVSLFSLLPNNASVWLDDISLCVKSIEDYYQHAEDTFSNIETTIKQLPPEKLFINRNDFLSDILRFNLLDISGKTILGKDDKTIYFQTVSQINFNRNFNQLIARWVENYEHGIKNFFCSENVNQTKRIKNIIHEIIFKDDEAYSAWDEKYKNEIEKNLVLFLDITLHEGFTDSEQKIAFYTDHQVFNRYHRYRMEDRFAKKDNILLKEIYDLQPGDYITHIDHGVGKYAGLEKIEVNGKTQEAIKIIYKNNDILYISIHSLHKISKYSGKDGREPTLNLIGSNAWNKLKERTKNRVKELVIDLTKLYAERKQAEGFSFSADNFMQAELEASFIYEDTPDQFKATNDVKKDMEADFPMDRLICGDVGFGKTEIAIRAAFKTVCDSKQVVLLVPTTILALQHYNNFKERLENFPCKVAYLNRFTTAKTKTQILKDLSAGKIDILIGTHKILGKDIVFKDLGLLIIDEEQKFGVEAKEKLRSFKVNVDTLTLTATPIPRTLQFSLMGARDISIIRTPPLNRYPIQTELHVFSEELIRDAIAYELFRGGQVFFVHNRVQNLAEMAEMIQRHFPDQRIAIAHGQMDGKKLEKTMIDFIDGLYDILVSTTIIESGLDIPNANTIIINDAQNYGLSDLHQLRGRVGRKNKKAFCYLITPPLTILPENARKRLKAIEEFSDIGSGFNIAMRDLDIRGAGNLLGAEQSGFITEIGYEMYQKILEEAIAELDNKKQDEDTVTVRECVIETDLEALIPDFYVNNSGERYHLYKELNAVNNEEELAGFKNRLIDRFGEIPQQTIELLESVRLRWLGKNIGFEKLVLKNNKLTGHFTSNQNSAYYDGKQFAYILSYMQQHPQNCYMRESPNKLIMVFNQVSSVKKAIDTLSQILLPE